MNAADEKKAFLGVGLSFPPCLKADGQISTVAFEEDIDQAIRIILRTNPGERVMRPDFGAGLNAFVFEPISVSTMHLVKTRVQEALIDWEPRIDVQEVKVRNDRSDPSRLMIDITYRVRATNTVRNLVFPFYLQEGTAP
ncbi:MAG TPA: GPW/gp25 family protein [Pyrinomonadaceae bacterium]|nr:GPW/gp25 family protein [Pyrinomonadaceae bacterium]